MVRGGEVVETTGYVSDVITDDAITLLKKHVSSSPGTPFYLSVHYTAPRA
jgi:hypothetical protein